MARETKPMVMSVCVDDFKVWESDEGRMVLGSIDENGGFMVLSDPSGKGIPCEEGDAILTNYGSNGQMLWRQDVIYVEGCARFKGTWVQRDGEDGELFEFVKID